MTRIPSHATILPAVAAAIAFCSLGGTAKAADLVVTAYGGIWEKAFRECYVAEFEKKTGKKVEVVLGTPTQWANQVAASSGKPPIDVIVNTVDGAFDTVKRGIVDKFDPAKLPHLAEIDPKFVEIAQGYGSIVNYGAMGIAYNKKSVKNPPASWKDFIEGVKKGEWKVAIPHISYVSTHVTTLWMLNNALGGTVDNVQPGLDAIKAMKDSGNLVFWKDPNEFLNLIKSGEIDLGMYWDGRTWAFVDEGNPDISYYNPKPGSVINPTLIQKTKGSPELAWDFIDVVLSPGPQACFGNIIQYGMSNTKVTYSPKVGPRITKMSEIVWPPFSEVPSRLADWVERWNKQIGG
jgi:putative spermidine/putrescine transport system substrate-binding protein